MTTTTPADCPTCSAAVPAGRATCPVCQQALTGALADRAIAVAPDDDLAAVLAAAPMGATVTLAPGDYTVPGCLVVTRSLTLQGAGRDLTRIDSAAIGSVLRFAGEGTLVLRGLHLRHVGEPWAHGVVVEGGAVVIQGCRIEDGRPGEGFSDMGHGVRIGGAATGTVSRSEVLGHGGDGIAVAGEARVTLEDNLCRGNRQSGITFLDKATGEARRNRCEANGKNGIAVFQAAAPVLEDNTLVGNGTAGLRHADRAGGEARRNRAEGNRNGAAVDDQAAPRLVENHLVDNAECGLLITGRATPHVSDNRVEANGWDGIFVSDAAAPALSRNQVTDNRRNGLAYFEQARGRAVDNRVLGNACDGIALFAAAAPHLEGNRVEGNHWNGIMYFDTSGGAAVANSVEGHSGSGIVLTGEAAPLVVANRLARNGEFGLAYRAHARGAADGNVFAENGLGELQQDRTAKPAIDKGKAHAALAAVPVAPTPVPQPASPPSPPPASETSSWQLTPADDLARAIAVAPAGATITLAAGVYPLAERLDIDKPLRIVGAGRDQTRLVSRAEGFVMRSYGRGGLALEGIHLAHEGEAWAHGLMIDGPAEIRACRFTGASRDATSKLGGCGVWLCAKATGTIANCEFSGNVYGLAVQASEPIQVAENHAVDNEVGFAFLERSRAVALENRSEKNLTGLLVDAEAQPGLFNNRLTHNRKHGVLFQGQSGGMAHGNRIEANGGDGVRVRDEAAPTLADNTVIGNGGSGLRFGGTRGGRVIDNRCEGNGAHGVGVFEQARPALERNHLVGNRGFGLAYFDQAAGSAHEHRIEGNREGAIAVGLHAAPVVGPRQGEVVRIDAAPPAEPAPARAAQVVRIKPGADLVQVLKLAATDTEIELEPGTYRASRTLTIHRSVTLRAVGAGAVRIVSTAQKVAIKVVEAPRFAMHGIWVERETPRFGEVMVVNAGELTLRGCVVSGGRNDTNHGRGGDGLRIIGKTTGTVEGCEFKHNQGLGIAVCDAAQPTLRANHLHHNHLGGIGYYQQAGGAAERNRCVSNQHSGIKLFNQAAPTLWSNELVSNERSGITYMDMAAGRASQNTCSTNHYYGVELMDQSRPRIEGNVLVDNRQDGFCCGSAEVRAVVKGNVCERNGGRGIYVTLNHRLTLADNIERDNRGEA